MALKAGTYRFNNEIESIGEIHETKTLEWIGSLVHVDIVPIPTPYGVSITMIGPVVDDERDPLFGTPQILIVGYVIDGTDTIGFTGFTREDLGGSWSDIPFTVVGRSEEADESYDEWFIANTNYNEVNQSEDKDYFIKESTLTAIADAIRNKKDTSEAILTEDMANEILDISSGIIEVNELPTENIDTDAAYLCNGFLYRYITDDGSSIGTWTFNKEFTSYVDSSITLDGDYGYFYGPTSTKDSTLTQYPIQTIRSDPYGVAGREYIKFKCSTEIFSQVDSGFSGYPNEWGSNIYMAAGVGYGSGYFDYDDELHRTVIITREIENDALRAHFRANAIKHETGWVRYLSPSGSLTFEENGTFDVTDKVEVVVNIPLPSGSIEITENGTFDITDKEEVIVNIGASSIISNGTMITIDLAPVIQDGENIIIGG